MKLISTGRNLIVGAGIALIPVLAGAYAYYWFGERQQLTRACWDALLPRLVAPSTAKLVDVRIYRQGEESLYVKNLRRMIQAESKILSDGDKSTSDYLEKSNLKLTTTLTMRGGRN